MGTSVSKEAGWRREADQKGERNSQNEPRSHPKGARVILIDKGKLESSGCLGGGHDHFMAVLHSGEENDTTEAVVDFYKNPMHCVTPTLVEEARAA